MIDPELERKINEIYRRLDSQRLLVTQNKGHMHLSAHMTGLAVSTVTIIEYDSWEFNCNGIGLNGNGAVVQERGLYLIIQNVGWVDLAADSRAYSRIEINGSIVDVDQRHTSKAANINTRNVIILECDVSDKIKGYYWHDSAGNPYINGSTAFITYLQFHLLSRQCK